MDGSEIVIAKTLAGSDLTGIGGILLIIVLVIIPFIVKFWNWSKETSAQGMLYQQLSETVQKQRTELDKLYEDRQKDQREVFELRGKVDSLIGYEQQAETLKKKLDQKDQIIAERDARITSLLEELMKMKDRVHNLELRLKSDEDKWCDGCQYKNNQYLPPTLEKE